MSILQVLDAVLCVCLCMDVSLFVFVWVRVCMILFVFVDAYLLGVNCSFLCVFVHRCEFACLCVCS